MSTALVELWEEVYGEALMLCSAIEKIPDSCECGKDAMHLEGHCPCCGDGHPEGGTNCVEILSQLRADLLILCNDFALISKPVEVVPGNPAEMRRDMLLSGRELETISKTVQAVGDAVVGFRQSCDLQQLQNLKRHAVELRRYCGLLNTLFIEAFKTREEQ